MRLRALLTAAVPVSIALVAFLDARAVSALVDGTVTGSLSLGEARAAAAEAPLDAVSHLRSADAILDRNPFDHLKGPLRVKSQGPDGPVPLDGDPRNAPPCAGVRPLVLVGDEDQTVAFASIEVGGRHVLRRRGGDVGGRRVAYVGRDRIWLEGETGLCQARLFGATPAPVEPGTPPAPGTQTALESEIGKHIVKTGPNEFAINRPTVNRILEAQQELMKARITPDKEGDRIIGMKVTGIKPGSVLAQIGIENGDRLETLNGYEMSDPEKMLEAYARLRSADRLSVRLTRAGKTTELGYAIR